MSLKFSKGHGTGNDFVLIYDPNDEIQLSEKQIKAICDRSFGIGADGLIKIVKKNDVWFMDYRNSDGSIAEICGNGTRVMARFLTENKIIAQDSFVILTRAGEVQVSINQDKTISVVLGPVLDQKTEVRVRVSEHELSGRLLTAPNPHVISMVSELDLAGPLLAPPTYEPKAVLPNGANFEFVQIVGPREVSMRVFERGVGETLSCGSGACAVGIYMQQFWQTDDPITVYVPGGKLIIEKLPNDMVKLTGPAEIVASGEIYLEKLYSA